ncbi:MAG: hypothetical protein ACYS22_00490 [Planctomycetota bacterium]
MADPAVNGPGPEANDIASASGPTVSVPELALYLGQACVLDTLGPLVYLGDLTRVTEHFFELRSADVHDLNAGHGTKERYVLEAARTGVRKSREEVLVRRDAVISLSRLSDVTLY